MTGLRGIVIKPEFPRSKDRKSNFDLKYSFYIGNYEQEHPFLTTDPLRRQIGRLGLKNGTYIGKIWIKVDKKNKTLQTVNYLPLGYPSLRKKGIATLLELRIERELLKKYPHFLIGSTRNPDKNRKLQLEHRGRKVGRFISLQKARALTQKQAISDFRRNYYGSFRFKVKRGLNGIRRFFRNRIKRVA